MLKLYKVVNKKTGKDLSVPMAKSDAKILRNSLQSDNGGLPRVEVGKDGKTTDHRSDESNWSYKVCPA